jgi:hypothetical protein
VKSLIATIKTARPDLLTNVTVPNAQPIPLEIPSHFLQPVDFVPDIGEPINPCFLRDSYLDPTGW